VMTFEEVGWQQLLQEIVDQVAAEQQRGNE